MALIDTEHIRPYGGEDEAAVVRVWYRAGRVAYPFLPLWQALTLEGARDVIRARCELWVAADEERVVGFLAMAGSYVDRLYVEPDEQRRGWGSRLIVHAKKLHPEGLELHTHQANYAARAFYEARGFVAVAFGISPPPELSPDVEYRWSPLHG